MLPSIYILGREIPMYGICAAFGIGLAFFVTWLRTRRLRREGRDVSDVFYLLLYAMIGVLIGAKLLYFIQNLGTLLSDFSLLFTNPGYFFGGFVFYGGLIGGASLKAPDFSAIVNYDK